MDDNLCTIIPLDSHDLQGSGCSVHADVKPSVGIFADTGALPSAGDRVRHVRGDTPCLSAERRISTDLSLTCTLVGALACFASITDVIGLEANKPEPTAPSQSDAVKSARPRRRPTLADDRAFRTPTTRP